MPALKGFHIFLDAYIACDFIRKIRINKQQRAAKIREIREIRGKKILTKLELLFHIVEKNFFQLLLISFPKKIIKFVDKIKNN